jgi:hypothetical protein
MTHAQEVMLQTQEFVDRERKRTGKPVPFQTVLDWLDQNEATYHSGIFNNVVGITYAKARK